MKTWIKEHWIEVATFGGIFAVFAICCAPDMTWINTDCDGIHYTYAAKYLYPAHKTSAPLFLLLGHLFLQVPLGSEFWRFAMLSVLASTASAVVVYLIVKEKLGANRGKLYGIIGALVFGGSALVISQSTIVESYALVTLCGLLGYYFVDKGKYLYGALALGAGIAIHHLIFIPLVVLIVFYKEFRKWKYAGVMGSFFLFYLYIPITNRPPYIWASEGGGITTFFTDISTTVLMLTGGISIWDFPKRVIDAIGIIGVCFGLALIPILYFFFKERHTNINPIRVKWYKEPLFWLLILPIVYYVVDLAPQTYVYIMPAIGFGAVIAGLSLSKMRRYWKWAVLGFAIGLLVGNGIIMDIGRTLDPNLSASQYYYEELDKVPNGDILIPNNDWEWVAVFVYNKEFARDIQPICIGLLPSLSYQEILTEQGIILDGCEEETLGIRGRYIAESIVTSNDNDRLWTTSATNPETYAAEIIPIKESDGFINTAMITSSPKLKWKPSNPYDIITGAIEINEWRYLTWSNYSMMTFAMMGIIGLVPCYIGYQVIVKKKKWSLRKNANKK